MPCINAAVALIVNFWVGHAVGRFNVEFARTRHVHLERIIEGYHLLRRIPRHEELSGNQGVDSVGVELVFECVANTQVRDGDVKLPNVGVDGRDLFHRGVEILYGVGSGGHNVAVGLMHANEVDMHFVA